eukprot:CAMPEP_0197684842 /NCGR_PEP_ID=MMETSP1338-20131121/100040_1 /TAXON_ID=43686 ORGANISM="Pelagodinium beii, Strain RCC1491" /NCGR_SAMPLE_ID=MMETSP1338 /ASSEMBLY_ACC=CAM_ASM_000754 /LENGTH=33 /DNA_ID= /DNA_START= /DNA_END= /DNA_ORIENTATION=
MNSQFASTEYLVAVRGTGKIVAKEPPSSKFELL